MCEGQVAEIAANLQIENIRSAYASFGMRGIFTMGLAKLIRKPLLMTLRNKSLAYPVQLRARTSDLMVYEEVVLNDEYRFDLPQSPKVILDIGANIGLTSAYFATRYPDARILAIEPEAENFRLLRKNLEPYKNVRPIRAALWSNDTRVELKDTGSGSWAFQVEESSTGAIPAVTLSTLLAENEVSYADLVKIDIEGAEREVFAGALDWVSNVGLLMIELHDRFKPGCSDTVCAAMSGRSTWTKGQVRFFGA
jgi:FkbM family methyltransferase